MKLSRFTLLFFFFQLAIFAQNAGEWSWISGGNTFDQQATWGTKGAFGANNTPGNKRDPIFASDQVNNIFWMFGGVGNDATSFPIYGSELWKFDPTTKQWAWTNGTQTATTYPVFGTKGVPAASNMPGMDAAQHAVVDKNGLLWVYFGSGPNNNGNLWNYNRTTDMWTWMGGSGSTTGNYGVLGTKGVPNANNTPGIMSENLCMWVDNSNNLWMYSSFLKKATNKYVGIMWKFDQTVNQWAWMAGDTINGSVYGTKGSASATTQPGQAWAYAHWTDLQGNFWMFGGSDPFYPNQSNSLWKFNPTTAQWTWMGGNQTYDQAGVYGTQGVASSTNWPGSRGENAFCWTDKCGNLWMFGGSGFAENPNFAWARLDDLWMYDIKQGVWTWKQGSKLANQTGSYGTKGSFSASNYPPSRSNGASYTDKDGNFYLWGGDNGANSSYRNDLWMMYTQPKKPVVTPASCGANDGTATVDVFFGVAPYTYTWNSGNATTTNTATNLAAGQYTVNIVDVNGCIQTDTFTIANNGSNLQATVTNLPSGCGSNPTGSATVIPNGGNGSFTYSWSNGQSNATATGLSAGVYSITVTDGSGCSYSSTTTISQSNAPSVTSTSTNTGCGVPSGTAEANPTGGTAPYSYSWSNGEVDSIATGLDVGTYTISITDANGCTANTTATVAQPLAPTVNTTSTPADCSTSNGSASATANGGTAPLSYSWNTGQTTQNISNISAGIYTVTVTDANSCSDTSIVTVKNNSTLQATAVAMTDLCDPHGTITAGQTGGTPTYSYSWSNGQTVQTATDLSQGTYTLTVTDGNGCSSTISVSTANLPAPNVNAGVDQIITEGSSVTITATGGINYSWTPSIGLSATNINSPTASPTITTTYAVYVTDANGCTGIDSVTVFVEPDCFDEVFVPTAFSPNGDQLNDVLYIRNNCIQTLLFSIYNRWGEKVFETTTITNGWDGSYNGKMLDPGVYVFYLSYTLKQNNQAVELSGNITLVR